MEEVVPGVWHWTAMHPRIGQQVHSHWIADSRVVLDPMVPPEGMPVFDPAPERVVLTNRHHLREGGTFADELGGVPILGPGGRHARVRRGRSAGGRLRGGRRGRAGRHRQGDGAIALDDHVLHIRTRGEGLLAFGDAIIVWDGELTFVPDFLMDEPDKVKKDTVERAVPLLALDFDHLLFAHGDPVIGRGRTALAEFMENPRSADFGV